MASSVYKPLLMTRMHAGVVVEPPLAGPKPVGLDSPAMESMTDLRQVAAATIRAHATVAQANRTMIARGVRLLLVVDVTGAVEGLITAHDIVGEKPVNLAHEAGRTQGELTVADLMVARSTIDVLDIDLVRRAEVGHVVATLKKSGRQHALVVDRDRLTREEFVRGIFSATQIGRQLGMPITTFEVAHTFSEIEAELGSELTGADDSAAGRFDRAIARFDAANAEDPNRETVGGRARPKELVYAKRMTAMLTRFTPDASLILRLTVRCQHIEHWKIPRGDYAMDRIGYLQWRKRLKEFHAQVAGDILRDVGYDEPSIAHVATLLRKEALKADLDAQALEDVAGLVFLERYLGRFVAGHGHYDAEKFADILAKTAKKMSARGRAAAVTLIALPPELAPLVRNAMEGTRA